MRTYWASMFVLPKGVINRVDCICRNYLWEGGTEFQRVPMISWQRVCSPKKEGGLGLKESGLWNIANIGKLVWWLATKPDKLWVQWIHHIYMKGLSWHTYSPSADTSWHWRKVCQVRDIIKAGFVDEFWIIGTGAYTVSGCYNWLREKKMQVEWYKSIWNTIAAPKHSFMAWLIANQALRLKDRLVCYNVASDDLCWICAFNPETHAHLFQECLYAQQVLKIVLCRLGTHLQGCDILKQIARRRWTSGRKHVTTATILAVWYMIWMQRNSARLTHQVIPLGC
ncbi:uncharacterized protein LOC141651430 [Silene latifolia]|uniref:uncharacterized protein LOC141651430 n=1 Tax=Silene latifolia TaxID=37657 RepID=UPI003D78B132